MACMSLCGYCPWQGANLNIGSEAKSMVLSVRSWKARSLCGHQVPRSLCRASQSTRIDGGIELNIIEAGPAQHHHRLLELTGFVLIADCRGAQCCGERP